MSCLQYVATVLGKPFLEDSRREGPGAGGQPSLSPPAVAAGVGVISPAPSPRSTQNPGLSRCLCGPVEVYIKWCPP